MAEKNSVIYNFSDGVLECSGTGIVTRNWKLEVYGKNIDKIQPDYDGCYHDSNIKTIIIEDGITGIGKNAFSYCESLASINIPNSVTSIKENAFSYCKSLASINIPNNVTSIMESVFSYCESLASINIPNSVISIGKSAFSYCKSLTNIHIPNSVTNIGKFAFDGCSSLTSIDIPTSVTSIGDEAFSKCKMLERVNYSGTREEWKAINKGGIYYEKRGIYSMGINDKILVFSKDTPVKESNKNSIAVIDKPNDIENTKNDHEEYIEIDLSNNPVAMFIKENLPNGNYKTYFAPDISDEIMANALTFILRRNRNTPIEINSSHVVAVCVVDESSKGLNALVFTHEALYPKFDASYRKINYEKIVSLSLEGSDGLKIEYGDEKVIYIPENFSTDDFAQFLIKLSDYRIEKQDDLIQEIISTGDFSLAKDITSYPVDKLLSYRDKYGNDILMLSILYDIPDVYNYILNNINSFLEKSDYGKASDKVYAAVEDILSGNNEFISSYSHKNNFDHSFLHFASKAGKRKTIVERYYTYNHFSLLSYEEKNKIDEIISRSNRNIQGDKVKSVANTIGNGIFDLFFRPAYTERLESEKELDKMRDEAKLKDRYGSCATQVKRQKNNFEENFSSSISKSAGMLKKEISKLNKQINDIISDCETRITQLNKQKEKERNRLEQEIAKFKNSVMKELNVPKGEFETTAQYQERMKKLEEIKNSFETRFADELQNITETVQQEVEWNIRQIDDELKQLEERKLQVETNAAEYYETAHIVRTIKEKESEMEYYSFITNARKKNKQQTNAVAEQKESSTTSMVKPTFYKSKKFSSVKLGQYNADEEFFAISIDGEEHILRIPISIAPDFKQSFKAKQIVSDFEIEDAHIVERIVAIYDGCKYPID